MKIIIIINIIITIAWYLPLRVVMRSSCCCILFYCPIQPNIVGEWLFLHLSSGVSFLGHSFCCVFPSYSSYFASSSLSSPSSCSYFLHDLKTSKYQNLILNLGHRKILRIGGWILIYEFSSYTFTHGFNSLFLLWFTFDTIIIPVAWFVILNYESLIQYNIFR